MPRWHAGHQAGLAPLVMRRIRLTLAYDGTAFHGWQVQPGLPTIQGVLEDVFSEIEGQRVCVAGSGRTDAGVHAAAQVAAVTLSNPIPFANLRRAANRLLPPAVRILEVSEAAPDFDPRRHAVAKTYEYRIWRLEVCPPFEWPWVHHHPYPLDIDAFIGLAPLVEGTHDFTAFAASDDSDGLGLSKVRTIFSSAATLEGPRLLYRVRGSGFLKHMVRNIVGVLLEAGKGNLGAAGPRAFLLPPFDRKAGPTAPAKGLHLMGVEY